MRATARGHSRSIGSDRTHRGRGIRGRPVMFGLARRSRDEATLLWPAWDPGRATSPDPARTPTARRPYAPGLDGLRALAVTAVVIYHVNPSWLSGGFLGVDVFFGLSGFLITDLLLAERRDHGRVDLPGFWLRRARRLLPALFVVLLATSAVAAVMRPHRLVTAAPGLLSAVTFTNNWWQIATDASYFANFGPPPLFQHLWTLSVEEQFYLVWPLLLLVLLRHVLGRGPRVAVVLACACVSMTAMALLYEPGADPSRVYFGTDTHVFPLLMGAGLALARPALKIIPRRSRLPLGAADALGVLGLAVLVTMMWRVSQSDRLLYPLGFAAVAFATSAAVLGAVQPLGRFASLLGLRPLRWIGVRSYGIYLWHLPLIALATPDREAPADVPVISVVAAVLSVVLAACSYRWVEQPIRRYGLYEALRRLRRACAGTAGARRTGVYVSTAALCCITAGTLFTVVDALTESDETAAVADEGARHPAGGAPSPAASGARPRVSAPPAACPIPGSRISAIGDSVMVAAASALKDRFPGITVDAKVGRQLSVASEKAQDARRNKTLGDVLIIGLGTNGPGEGHSLQDVVDVVGPGTRVVLVTCHVPRPWQDEVNRNIRKVAAANPNVVVADWHRAISGHEDLLADDGVHPGPAGARLYADTIAKALTASASQHRS